MCSAPSPTVPAPCRRSPSRCQASERGIRILCDTLTISGFLTKSGETYETTPDTAMFLVEAIAGVSGERRRVPALRRVPAPLRQPRPTPSGAARSPRTANTVAPEQSDLGPVRAGDDADDDGGGARDCRPPRSRPPHRSGCSTSRPATAASASPSRSGTRRPKIVAVDWAPVLTVAAENAKAMGVAARFRTLPGDAITIEYPTGFDVALLANFLHHFDRADLRRSAQEGRPPR